MLLCYLFFIILLSILAFLQILLYRYYGFYKCIILVQLLLFMTTIYKIFGWWNLKYQLNCALVFIFFYKNAKWMKRLIHKWISIQEYRLKLKLEITIRFPSILAKNLKIQTITLKIWFCFSEKINLKLLSFYFFNKTITKNKIETVDFLDLKLGILNLLLRNLKENLEESIISF